MHVNPESGTRAYASATVGAVISRAKDTHTPNRVVRVGDEWDEVGEIAGPRMRAELVRQFFRWYLRHPGAKLPERPPRR